MSRTQASGRRIAALVALALLPAALALVLVTQPGVTPIASIPPAVDPARLQAHVKQLSVTLHPRSHDSPRLGEAADYVLEQLRAAGGRVSVQPVQVGGTTFRNLVARFGPETGAVLVIGAHYDSHEDTPGADDNASGVAGLIELARLLAAHPPPRPVELVAYTLEEPPYFRTSRMGSAVHARALQAEGRALRLMLSLEMIGFFSDVPGSQGYPVAGMSALYGDRGDFIALVGRLADFGTTRRAKALMAGATDLPVKSINAPRALHGVDFSDHLNYWDRDLPALMVTDTSFMRNPHYHLASDTHEKLDYARMAKVVQGVFALAQRY